MRQIKLIRLLIAKVFKKVSLRFVLIVPLVLHIFLAVDLVGYISLKNCQHTVDVLANQMIDKVSNVVKQQLDAYLAIPHQINQLNINAIKLGVLDLHNSQKAEHYFGEQIRIFDVSHIGYRLATGEFIGVNRWLKPEMTTNEANSKNKNKVYTYTTDSQGSRGKVIQYDHKPRLDWYSDTVKVGNSNWSAVYPKEELSGVISTSIAANYPIYDYANNILGITSSELCLENISEFLRSIKIGDSGKTFIIEQNGLLVADSSSNKLFNIINGTTQRLNVLDSSDHLIQATGKYLLHKFGDFREIKDSLKLSFYLDGERQFIHVEPWRDNFGLEWLVVAVVPEGDFMAQTHANARIIFVLCIVALLLAISLGLTLSRWIIRPVQRLSKASRAIAKGDLNQKLEIEGINELGLLSQSFNQMVLQLKESFEQLETRVEQRTIELKDAKQAAEAANRAKSEFLANMSHELRTPLNAILGFAQLMNRDSSLTPQQQENTSIINRSGEHLLSLINNVLDISKIDSDRTILTENTFDLCEFLNTIQKMFQLKAEFKGLQILVECNSAIPQYLHADEGKLRQVLINLLGNAIKFTQEGGVILRVGVKEGKQGSVSIIFEVEDTGPGIAPHEFKSLFEPFMQTETGQKSQQGTGLGLPISRKFVQLMGGDITVSSTLNRGTIFQFDIQVKLAEATDLSKPQQRQVLGLEPGQPSYRILVVDDRWENRRLLTKLLVSVGFEVREAENGQEAIALWLSWEPHLIWMDMRMPVMNGYEATKQIKSHLKGQATTIVALTASVIEEEQAIVLGAGCDDFVRKPFREEAIWEKMAQFLGVRYVYADSQSQQVTLRSPTSSDNTDASSALLAPLAEKPDYVLRAESLTVMPAEWVAQLQQAATQLNANQICQLITQIPEKYISLAKALQQKVNDFDFDQILNLT